MASGTNTAPPTAGPSAANSRTSPSAGRKNRRRGSGRPAAGGPGARHCASSFSPARISAAVAASAPSALQRLGDRGGRLRPRHSRGRSGRAPHPRRPSAATPAPAPARPKPPPPAGALSFSSSTSRAASFGPTPGARAIIALSCRAIAWLSASPGSAPRMPSATLAPTPCTLCSSRNQSRSALGEKAEQPDRVLAHLRLDDAATPPRRRRAARAKCAPRPRQDSRRRRRRR